MGTVVYSNKCSKCGYICGNEINLLENWACPQCTNNPKSKPKYVVKESTNTRGLLANFLVIEINTLKILATCYSRLVAEILCDALNGNKNSVS